MKRIVQAVGVALLLLATLVPMGVAAPANIEEFTFLNALFSPTINPLKADIYYWARFYGVSGNLLYRIANCESNLNNAAINKNDPNGGSFGIMQFQINT